jgi:hypothetical protein
MPEWTKYMTQDLSPKMPLARRYGFSPGIATPGTIIVTFGAVGHPISPVGLTMAHVFHHGKSL